MVKTSVSLEMQMQQALTGDKRAYADLLRDTALFLRPYLSKRLSAANDVDDLLQEILVSIHKARHTYDGQRPYKPWVFAIAHFRLQDYLRTYYADQLRSATELGELENTLPADVTNSDFSYESISGEVNQLPEKQAVILAMMHEEGYTAKEVAAKIGMKESAVKVAAFRAYKILREKLSK
ncbi:MAG: sigma-70 family RNA polymerase sigma factor [Sulfuriferula sp.]